MQSRTQEIGAIWRANQWLYGLVGFVLGALATPTAALIRNDLTDLLGGLVPETVGILVTVLVIDRLYNFREQQRRVRELQEQLLRDTRSRSNERAKAAVDELRFQGWLGLLQGHVLDGANLANANLDGVDLSSTLMRNADLHGATLRQANLRSATMFEVDLGGADLTGADLTHAVVALANLREAQLWGAKLNEVSLGGADLTDAVLLGADLTNADLSNADLTGADFMRANMANVNLVGANLRGANLQGATFSTSTRLPDATQFGYTPRHFWTEDTDMARYTDPDHPDFWSPGG